jgi:hypothetical protein
MLSFKQDLFFYKICIFLKLKQKGLGYCSFFVFQKGHDLSMAVLIAIATDALGGRFWLKWRWREVVDVRVYICIL